MMHAPWSFVPFEDDSISCKPREDKFGAMVEEIDFIDTWKEMEKCVELGLCKYIAVSNFSSKQLERISENCKIQPIINQVESHAYNKILLKINIQTEATVQFKVHKTGSG